MSTKRNYDYAWIPDELNGTAYVKINPNECICIQIKKRNRPSRILYEHSKNMWGVRGCKVYTFPAEFLI